MERGIRNVGVRCDQWTDRRDTEHDGISNYGVELSAREDRLGESDRHARLAHRNDRLERLDGHSGPIDSEHGSTELMTLAIEHADISAGLEPEDAMQMRPLGVWETDQESRL